MKSPYTEAKKTKKVHGDFAIRRIKKADTLGGNVGFVRDMSKTLKMLFHSHLIYSFFPQLRISCPAISSSVHISVRHLFQSRFSSYQVKVGI